MQFPLPISEADVRAGADASKCRKSVRNEPSVGSAGSACHGPCVPELCGRPSVCPTALPSSSECPLPHRGQLVTEALGSR